MMKEGGGVSFLLPLNDLMPIFFSCPISPFPSLLITHFKHCEIWSSVQILQSSHVPLIAWIEYVVMFIS